VAADQVTSRVQGGDGYLERHAGGDVRVGIDSERLGRRRKEAHDPIANGRREPEVIVRATGENGRPSGAREVADALLDLGVRAERGQAPEHAAKLPEPEVTVGPSHDTALRQ